MAYIASDSKLTSGIWTFERVVKNIWKIYPSANYITMAAGTPVTSELIMPFAHRWNSTHFRHADASDDDSIVALAITIRRPRFKNTPVQFEEDMLAIAALTATKRSDTWGDSFERERSVYNIILESTLNHRIYCVFYVQKLED